MRGSPNHWIGQTFKQHAPQAEEPFVGFRLLTHDAKLGCLESPMIEDSPWPPHGIMKAECKPHLRGLTGRLAAGHIRGVVHHNCMCGLYAYIECKPPDDTFLFGVTVITQNWGKTQVHSTGYRSAYARIIGIVLPEETKINVKAWLNRIFNAQHKVAMTEELKKKIANFNDDTHVNMLPILEGMAKTYGVPLIPIAQAPAFAKEYGHLVTQEEIETWKKEEDQKFLRSTRFALHKTVLACVAYVFLMVQSLFLPFDIFEWGSGVVNVMELVSMLSIFLVLYTYIRQQGNKANERKALEHSLAREKFKE